MGTKLEAMLYLTVAISTVLILSNELTAETQVASVADRRLKAAFYGLIDAILIDSAAVQINALQNFIRSHPGFERAYLKLLERYIIYNQKAEATAYFQELTATSAFRRNSHWMLAKLFILQQDTSAALNAFHQALHAGPTSVALLKDFAEYLHQLKRNERAAVLSQVRLEAEVSKLITALFDFFNLHDEQAIRLFREISDASSFDDALIFDTWGRCYFRLYRYGEADSIWYLGLERSRLAGDLELEGRFLCNLGLLSARARDQYDRALSYCDSANTIANRLDDHYLKQLVMGYSAYVFTSLGNYAEAIKRYQEAIKLAKQLGLGNDLATWYHRCAQVFSYSRKYQEALQAYDQCEAHSRMANNEELLFLVGYGKGELYFYLRQNALARKTFQDAYDLTRRRRWSNQRYYGYACMKLADLMISEGQYERAIEIYRKFINSQQWKGDLVDCAYWIGRLAEAYKQGGHPSLAQAAYMRAYETAKQAEAKQYMFWYLVKAAQIELNEGDITGAIQKCTSASEIDTSKNNKELWAELYLTLGNAYKKAANLSKAISFYLRAADAIEGTRQDIAIDELRVGYFSTWHDVYRSLVQCFLDRYLKNGSRADLDSLFYYKEMTLSRALQDMRLRDGTAANQRNKNDFEKEYQKTCEQLRMMQRRIRQEAEKPLRADEWNQLFSQLNAARYSLVAQRLQTVARNSFSRPSRPSPIHFGSNVVKDLQLAGLGLMLYHISAEGSFVLVVANEEVHVVRLQVTPPSLAAALDSLIAPFHLVPENITAPLPFRASIAHRLYQLLIEPAEVALKLPPKLLIVPDLVLMNLPFEMLLVAAPDKPEYTRSDFPSYAEYFLLNRYTIVYSPSTALLQERGSPISRNPNILVLADPFGRTLAPQQTQFRSRTGWSFDALPFSEVEAQRIVEAYPATKVYTRTTAKKAVFIREAQQQDIVHIATHAFVDTTFDAFSGLVLAAGEDSTDDGMLMGYEIADLNLSCDLVTLSACETGRGKLVAGEGIIGLPRLFLGAGVKTVLMTLWKVDDKFAAELMPDFYDYFLNQRCSKAEALNKAKHLVLSKVQLENGVYYQHPFYWAAFTLYGDPGMNQDSSPYVTGAIAVLLVVLILAIYHRNARLNNKESQSILQ